MARTFRLPVTASLVLSIALIAAFLAAGNTAAEAASKPSGKAKILSPKNGSHPGKRLLVAKVRAQGKDFRAYLNGRNVTKRFKKTGRRSKVRKAVFRRGKDFRVGEGDLFVMAGKGYKPASDQHYFIATKRQNSLLRVRRVAKPSVLLPRFHIRSKRQIRGTKVLLNGRNVRSHFDLHDDLRGMVGQPGGSTSLRHGNNKLVTKVFQKDGRFASRTIRFTIPPTRPIASAGPDQRTGVGEQVSFTSAMSRKPKQGKGAKAPLKTSWKVVGAPLGSNAKADAPNSTSTTFTPDQAGTYRLQATVTAAGGVRSVDEVELDAPQIVTPMGMPIQTITSEGGIQIGFPDQAGAGTYPKLGNWVQMLVIDPDTGTPMPGQWDNVSGVIHRKDPNTGQNIPGILGFNQGSGGALWNAIRKTKFQQMVIVTGQGSPVTLSKSDQSNLNDVFKYLGGTLATNGTTPQGAQNLANGEWSLIGHQGLDPSQAFQNAFATQSGITGFLGGATGKPGSLNGYLQSGVTEVGFQYVATETVPIDTKWTPDLSTPPPSNQNTIMVGDEKYVSGKIDDGSLDHCPCSVAVQVLVLDPGTLEPTAGGTYGVLHPDGSTNFNGIYDLAQNLNSWVGADGPGQSSLVIVQDFGKWNGGQGPQNSADWIQDQLPDNSYTPKWKGNSYPTGAKNLLPMWTKGGPHGFGTVAGTLAKLAGLEVHDIVANYRRPVFDQVQGKVVPRDWGGLTIVASTNLYQWSSAFAKGQGDLAPQGTNLSPLLNNGRTTGALRRNQQSQWELNGATKGAGYPGVINQNDPNSDDNAFDSSAFAKLVYTPQVAWPCSEENPAPCLGTPAEVAAALQYISTLLPEAGNPIDVRRNYTSDSVVWGDQRRDLAQITCSGVPGINEPVCDEMKVILSEEFQQLDQVKNSFQVLTGVLSNSNRNVQLNLPGVAKGVTSAIAKARKDLLKQEATADIAGPIAEALYVSSDTLELALTLGVAPEEIEFAPAELGLTASLIDLGMELFPFFESDSPSSEDPVTNDTNAVTDRTSNLAKDMQYQLVATTETLQHFHDLVRTDPLKLYNASLNFATKWNLDTKNERRLAQSISIGASKSLYESIMPIAFNQWVFSPRNTTLNPSGVQDLPDRGYNCDNLDGDGKIDGFDNPLTNMPASMSGMTSVAWAANYAPNGQGHTVRALKLREDDIKIESAEFDTEYGDNYVEHKGGTTPAGLLDPLFEPPSDLVSPVLPNALGMDKDEFFGQDGWTMKKLQCGFAEN